MALVSSLQLSFVLFTVHDSKWLVQSLRGPLTGLAVVHSTSTSVKEANWLAHAWKITCRKHFEFRWKDKERVSVG